MDNYIIKPGPVSQNNLITSGQYLITQGFSLAEIDAFSKKVLQWNNEYLGLVQAYFHFAFAWLELRLHYSLSKPYFFNFLHSDTLSIPSI